MVASHDPHGEGDGLGGSIVCDHGTQLGFEHSLYPSLQGHVCISKKICACKEEDSMGLRTCLSQYPTSSCGIASGIEFSK
jgi:hypothetical protein